MIHKKVIYNIIRKEEKGQIMSLTTYIDISISISLYFNSFPGEEPPETPNHLQKTLPKE